MFVMYATKKFGTKQSTTLKVYCHSSDLDYDKPATLQGIQVCVREGDRDVRTF